MLMTRLAATTLPIGAVAPLRPVRIADWVAQHRGKRFIGNIEGQHFKIGLLQKPGARFRWRGNVVVIIGFIEGQTLQARFRLPISILAFLCVFATAMSAVLVLSYFGPTNTTLMHGLLAGCLVLPIGLVAWLFRRETDEAEHALRQVMESDTASTQPRDRNGGS